MIRFEVGKLTGSANTKTWAQVHIFTPSDQSKKENFGDLFAVFSLKSRATDPESLVEIAAFGREILTRFHESYFSAETTLAVHKRLENAFKIIEQEFSDQVYLSGAAAIILEAWGKRAIYLARLGEAQVYLWRSKELVSLLGSSLLSQPDSVSGWFKPNDVVLLGTDSLFKIVPKGSLKAALQQGSLDQATQSLTPIVHGHEHNALAALVMVKLTEASTKLSAPPPSLSEVSPSGGGTLRASRLKEKLWLPLSLVKLGLTKANQGLGELLHRLGRRFPSHQVIAVHPQDFPFRKSRKTAISVAIVFLLLLAGSVWFGLRKQQTNVGDQEVNKLVEVVRYNLEQADQLAELNPGRAKAMLTIAQEAIETYQKEHGQLPSQLSQYQDQIAQQLAAVSREYKVEEAELFFDLSLVKEGFKAKRWGVTNTEAVILGQETVVTLDLEQKQSQVISGGEKVAGAKLIASVSPWAVMATDEDLRVIDKSKQAVIDTQEIKELKLVDLTGYAGNIYGLDTSAGQIWRWAGLSEGLAKQKEYLKNKADLGDAVSLAIDGSIWVLFKDGTISKFTRGEKDAFSLSGLDKPFAEPIRLFTDENQSNLYVLDQKNTRVVVLGKTGEYQAQYVWPGIAGTVDLLASEKIGKIFLLTDSRIYSLDIKK